MRLLSEDQLAGPDVHERAEAAHPNAIQPDAKHGSAFRSPDVSEREQAALQFWVKMSRAHNAIAAHAAADIARHGMTLAEFGILEALYHRGPLLLGEVQRRILVSSGGITFLVDRLTAKGLVERRQCPGDKRARYVELTAKGERFVVEAFPAHAKVIAQAIASLDDAELSSASLLLRQVGLNAAAQSIGQPAEQARTPDPRDQDCEGA